MINESYSLPSKQHSFIVLLLGVPRVVVSVNETDLVGFDRDLSTQQPTQRPARA